MSFQWFLFMLLVPALLFIRHFGSFHCVTLPMWRVFFSALAFTAAAVGGAPVVNVRLTPSKTRLPEVSAKIAELETSRASVEAAGLRQLDEAFEAARKKARARINAVLVSSSAIAGQGARSPTAFLGATERRSGSAAGFLLHVLPAGPVSNAVLKKIAAVERVRDAEERLLIAQGVKELGLLVDLVVSQLQASLRTGGAGFLGASSGGATEASVDVRVLPPAEPFATVAGLVAEMEARRDAAEDGLRKHIMELELKLLHQMNAMFFSSLH